MQELSERPGLLSVGVVSDGQGDDRSEMLLVVVGELCLGAKDRLCEATLTGERRRVLIDLRGVHFVDVCGLNALDLVCRLLTDQGCRVRIVPSTAVERLLDLLGQAGVPLALPIAGGGAKSGPDEDGRALRAPVGQRATCLRPVERCVLRLLRDGLSPVDVAVRFQRSPQWVERVAGFARRRLAGEL